MENNLKIILIILIIISLYLLYKDICNNKENLYNWTPPISNDLNKHIVDKNNNTGVISFCSENNISLIDAIKNIGNIVKIIQSNDNLIIKGDLEVLGTVKAKEGVLIGSQEENIDGKLLVHNGFIDAKNIISDNIKVPNAVDISNNNIEFTQDINIKTENLHANKIEAQNINTGKVIGTGVYYMTREEL